MWSSLVRWRKPIFGLVGSLSYRNNIRMGLRAHESFKREIVGRLD
jgi:hypothetical protein